MKDPPRNPKKETFRELLRNSTLPDRLKQAILDLDADAARLPLTNDDFRTHIAAAERRRRVLDRR